jgi:hypothetical protein
MTTRTDDLIRRLSRDVQPAPPLRRPFLRAAVWTIGAVLYVAFVVMWMAPPDAVMSRWSELSFTLRQIAALATAATAAAAAFAMTVPGRGRGALLAAVVAASAWVGLVASGCIQDWMAAGRAGLALRSDWACVAGIPMTAVIPGLALVLMLRRGAPLHPRATSALAALGVASLASLGMCLAQPHEWNIIVLVWHGATIGAMSVLGAIAGRSILNWTRLTTVSAAMLALVMVGPAEAGGQQPPARTVINVQALGPQVGARIPDFTLVDHAGTPRTLRSLMGPKGLMLVLFRSADW